MLRSVIILAAGAVALAAPAAQRDSEAVRDEQRLAKRLANMSQSGPPQQCITPSRSQSGESFGDTLIVPGMGGNIYVSRLDAGCRVRQDDAIISRRPTTQLCRGDIFEARDLLSGTIRSNCAYGDFVPWRRAPK